jgi:hypothetical protein
MSALALVFIGFFAGLWIDFIATPDVNFWLGLVAAPVLAFIHGWIMLTGSKLEGRARIPPNPVSRLIVYIGGTLMLAAVYNPGITRLAPYLLTRIAGDPYTERFVMQTDRTYSRRACDYQLTGGPINGLYANHLCISEDAYYRYPDQTVHVVLSGQRGPLGMTVGDIQSIQPVNAAP